MADGDKVVIDGQYEFRGFLFGANTGIIVETMEGLLSSPVVEPTDQPKAGDGMTMGRDRIAGKSWTGTLRPTGSAGAGIEAVLMAMEDAFQTTDTEYPFTFKRPGRVKRRIYCRCRRRDIPTSYDLAHGLGLATVEFFATDPRIYSHAEQMDDMVIATGQTQNSFDVYMNGNFERGTWPIIEIDGPANDLVIANSRDGNKQVQLDYNLVAGQTMTIDMGAKEVSVGGVSIYNSGIILPGTEWFRLLRGVNPITVIRQNSGADSNVRVRWRDAYA